MQIPINDNTFWIAYGASNVGGAILAYTGLKAPRLARYLFATLFAWACWFNLDTVFETPDVYLDYSYLAYFKFYADFINGFFADHVVAIITTVAICQGLMSLGFLVGGRWMAYAAIGAIAFFVSIAPLGIGSAFPSTVLMAVGAYGVRRSVSVSRSQE